MHFAFLRRERLAVALLAVAALVAACGSSNATSSPAASGGTASSAAPSASAVAPSTGSTTLEGISISAPYNLADLPATTGDAIQAGIEKNLGAYGKAVHVAMKSVENKGVAAAYLMVVQFPAGTLSDDIYAQVINNLSMGAESTFAPKLVNGVSVSFGDMSGGSVAVFRKGDLAFITLAPKATDLTPVVSALIKANG